MSASAACCKQSCVESSEFVASGGVKPGPAAASAEPLDGVRMAGTTRTLKHGQVA